MLFKIDVLKVSLNICFFKARTDCPVETMLRRASEFQIGHQTKNCFERNQDINVWLLKQFGATVL